MPSRKSSSMSTSSSRKTSSNSQADSGIGGGGGFSSVVDIDIGELADFDDKVVKPLADVKINQEPGPKAPSQYQMKRRLVYTHTMPFYF